jgi:hypothetical protein
VCHCAPDPKVSETESEMCEVLSSATPGYCLVECHGGYSYGLMIYLTTLTVSPTIYIRMTGRLMNDDLVRI